MSTDNKEDMYAEEEAAEDSRLIATATCTEEKFSSGCSPEVTFTRVFLIPGIRTVVTGLNLHDFRDWYTPDLVDVDFTITGRVLRRRMLSLCLRSDTYMTVRTGRVLCEYVHVCCIWTCVVSARMLFVRLGSIMCNADDKNHERWAPCPQRRHGSRQDGHSAVREIVLTETSQLT